MNYKHIVGCFNMSLYYNNAGYLLAQVMGIVFCQQMLQSILINPGAFVYEKLYHHMCQNITYIIRIETGVESTHYV